MHASPWATQSGWCRRISSSNSFRESLDTFVLCGRRASHSLTLAPSQPSNSLCCQHGDLGKPDHGVSFLPAPGHRRVLTRLLSYLLVSPSSLSSLCRTAAAKNVNHLYAIRLLQGIAESSTFVGVHWVMGSWYRDGGEFRRSLNASTTFGGADANFVTLSQNSVNAEPSSRLPLRSPPSSRACCKVRSPFHVRPSVFSARH